MAREPNARFHSTGFMRKFWETSLTARIIVTLGCAMTVFWVLSESISAYYRYINAHNDLRVSLVEELQTIAERENHRYDYAERQARALSWLWSMFHKHVDTLPTSQAIGRRSIFVPFSDAKGNADQVRRARDIIEIYGNADPRGGTDTFLLLPDEGIVFYYPRAFPFDDMQHKIETLSQLRYMPNIIGARWGATFRDAQGSVHVAVTVTDHDTGVIAGQSLHVGEFLAVSKELQENLRFILRSSIGEVLWSSISPQTLKIVASKDLPPCGDKISSQIDQYYVACMPLKGPPWQLAGMYSNKVVARQVLSLLALTVPWALLAQLLLLSVMYVTLRRQLGQPLRHIVDIIDAQRETDLGHRLPEARKDELGRIARAYNALLSTVHAYYQTLENKVRERTRELDEAKRLAESASHRKSEHIASISHEIRTPLNGVVGALSLLGRSDLTPMQHELVNTAQQSSSYLLGIVNNLLDFSRIEAGQLDLSFEDTALLPMLDQAMLTINIRAREKHLKLLTVVATDVPHHALLDGLRVRQILINLLGNAVKFTQRGHICVTVERRAGMLAFTVEDTGIGIPESYQLEIFKPFVQVRAHDSGNGLGLAIASRLATLMGGEILLESQIGQGTRFILLLPLRDAGPLPTLFSGSLIAPTELHIQLRIWGLEPESGENAQLSMPELIYLPGKLWQTISSALRGDTLEQEAGPVAICPWSLKILIIDDVEVNRDIIGKMLHELGHQTETAESGARALQLGQCRVFDLVLMDLRMPDMDGMETALLWRDSKKGMLDPDTPIIALTANALPAEHERAKQAGMDGYLLKPVSLEQLADAVNDAASLQLARGFDVEPNQLLKKPLFNLSDKEIRTKVYLALLSLHEQIEAAWHAKDTDLMLGLLHTLKGCAGQGGLDLVREAAEEQEKEIRAAGWPSRQDIGDLRELIAVQCQ